MKQVAFMMFCFPLILLGLFIFIFDGIIPKDPRTVEKAIWLPEGANILFVEELEIDPTKEVSVNSIKETGRTPTVLVERNGESLTLIYLLGDGDSRSIIAEEKITSRGFSLKIGKPTLDHNNSTIRVSLLRDDYYIGVYVLYGFVLLLCWLMGAFCLWAERDLRKTKAQRDNRDRLRLQF